MKVHWDANPTAAGVGFLSGLANLSLILCRHLHSGLKLLSFYLSLVAGGVKPDGDEEPRRWGVGVGRGLVWVGVDTAVLSLTLVSCSCGPWQLHLPAGGREWGRGWEAGFPLLLPRDGGRTVHTDGCCE